MSDTGAGLEEILPSATEALRGIGERFSIRPFRVAHRDLSPRSEARLAGAPDAYIDLEWGGWTQRFAIEYKSSGSPKQVDLAIQQVRRYTRFTPNAAPLIVAPYLREELLEQLLEEGVKKILLNLSDMDYIDSNGLGELVQSLKTSKRYGASLRLLKPQDRVTKTLRLTNLLPMFGEVYDSESAALKAFDGA